MGAWGGFPPLPPSMDIYAVFSISPPFISFHYK